MHIAVDHAWSTMILYRLGRIEEGRRDHGKSMQLYHALRPSGQSELPDMWFDFVELGIVLCELSLEFEHAPASKIPFKTAEGDNLRIPYSVCTDDFRLMKWRPMPVEIMDAALSATESTVAIALGGRPGTWESWDITTLNRPEFVLDEDKITRHVGGHPIRSIDLHPSQDIAALGRWHGTVDVVEIKTNQILATRETSEGRFGKANRVRFVNDGSHLLIGFHSTQLVDWRWAQNETVAQQIMPKPVWNFSAAGNYVLHAGRIWNRQTGELRTLAEEVTGSRFFDSGRKALIIREEKASIVKVASAEVISTLEFPSRVGSVAFLPLEKRMITGHDNGEFRLVDLESSRHIPLGHMNNNCAARIATHSCNRILLSTADKQKSGFGKDFDQQVAIWMLSDDLESKPLEQIESHTDDFEQRRSAVRAEILEELRDIAVERG
jgi:WD40 repeat protein